jgi:hypothetical protein
MLNILAGKAVDPAPVVAELRTAGVTSLRGIAPALNERGISAPWPGPFVGIKRKWRGS